MTRTCAKKGLLAKGKGRTLTRCRDLDVVFVGTYPPTQCGLATFTASLHDAVAIAEPTWTTGVVRLVDNVTGDACRDVRAEWSRNEQRTFADAARAVSSADCTIMQHEFGIFPGPDGAQAVSLAEERGSTLIVVLHTVLPKPSSRQRSIIESLAARADATVVQTQAAFDRLVATHDVDSSRVAVIPHGAAPNFAPVARLPRPKMLLTWGLIGPGKGIERGIRAFAAMHDAGSPAIYVVSGQTHPKVLEREGERYRESLMLLADVLGVGDRVVFDDEYRSWTSLRALIRHADAVLLPYDSRDQVTSGVLVEAIASGLPTVATAFPHAVEQLASGSGIVVPHDDLPAMTRALEYVLFDECGAGCMREQARRDAEVLLWPNVACRYCTLVESLTGRILV